MRASVKNDKGSNIVFPIQESDYFPELKKRLLDPLDVNNFMIDRDPINISSNILHYAELQHDEKTWLENQMCRLCGEVFGTSSMLDISQVKEIIINCLHLNVDSNGLLSNFVCQQCVEKLKNIKTFWDGCMQTEKKQLQIIEDHETACPFCNDKSGRTFVSASDYLNSRERHKIICSKSIAKSKVVENDKIFCLVCKKSVEVCICTERECHDLEPPHAKSELEDNTDKLFPNGVQRLMKQLFDNEKCYKVNFSGTESEDEHSFENSMKKTKPNKKYMYCDICPRSFRSKKRLEFHIKFHMRGHNARKCLICKKEYSSETYLYNHIQHNHSKKKFFHCKHCEKKFRNKSSLRYHLRSHESFEAMKPFLCNICERRFVRKISLQDHMVTSHGMGTTARPGTCFQCQICKEAFPNTNSGISHTEIHHSSEMNAKTGFSFNMHTVYKLFVCEFCDKCYSLSHDLMEHRLSHSPPLKHQCKICNEEFGGFIEMRRHLDDHIADGITDYKTQFEVPIYYVCEYCERYFKSSHAFSAHCNSHIANKKYTCQFCSKVSGSFSEILKHRKSHSKIENHQSQNILRPFECQFCQKAFTSNSALAKHIRTHTGEKPFKCGICCKNFTQSSGLNTHLKIHSNKKPFKCDFCYKSFKLAGNHKQHMKRHSMEKSESERRRSNAL